MKTKSKIFQQHLYHEIEDEDKAWAYLDEALPLIGTIVMYFNGLESALNNALCEIFTDRTDSVGLIVLHKMNYSSKVDLFKRFSDDFHHGMGTNIEGYEDVIRELKEAGRLRNLVVHADWENTDDDGYTYVDLRIKKSGMTQEYAQFSKDSLSKILEVIFDAHKSLGAYWGARENVILDWPKNT